MVDASRLDALADIEAAVWRELAQAVRDRAHAWRLAVLATADGEGADARTVVLRDLDEAARTLLIYTDPRSPKAQQLDERPLGTLVVWSPQLAWQLRLRVRLALHTSGLTVSSRWAQLKMTPAAQDYLSPLPPGSALAPAAGPPAPERGSREHFAVLTAEVLAVDWLELHALGHRRARFDADGARWVVP
ncbi:MAG: pyridoxamine 5'-phosphate oxidase family protein [Rubrivivax sp.]|nr:pyridoxamine 5'-phosphate oxidase family protein [Rubrivivax sp.]